MLTVHHLENSRSQRILWLLEELEADYTIRRYERDEVTRLAPAELVAIHPLGKSPVITDDGHTIAESGAIIEYLLDRYGKGRLRPDPASAEFQDYRYWLHFAEGSLMPLMVMSLVFNRMTAAKMPFFARPVAKGIAARVRESYIEPNTRRMLDLMERTLASRPWFAGSEMTGADVQMSFPIEAAALRGGLGGQHPRLQGFLQTIHARPAYRSALEKGGPYAFVGS